MADHQFPTKSTTALAIMRSPGFKLGFQDARNGVPFDWLNNDWNYERGRMFAHIAPLNMPLIKSGKLNPIALSLLEVSVKRSLVI